MGEFGHTSGWPASVGTLHVPSRNEFGINGDDMVSPRDAEYRQ